ncbi:MAG: hypothetical protein E7643_02215 [Ruminococcaceae bacterium]|nr:hypothetical protein [Oscillospiraceae bacterium]
MGPFFDLHNHMLCGVDDGAENREMMLSMLDMSYADGVRAICLTPHYSPYMFGDTFESSRVAFADLEEYAAKKYPDLRLFIGHELGYYHGCEEALRRGRCRTIAGSRYVLVDFPAHVEFFEIQQAMNRMRSMGFCTVLAHAERYKCLFSNFKWIEDYVSNGGLVQINASGVCERRFSSVRSMWTRLLQKDLVHVIASDGHNLVTRPPLMSVCVEYLKKHFSEERISELMWENALCIVENRNL